MSASAGAAQVAQGNWTGSLSVDQAHDLISLAKSGDRQAFASLYREYVPVVHRYVAARISGAARVEDLVADTFVKALRNIERFEFRGIEFSAWLVRIARNLILDQARSSHAKLEITTDVIPDLTVGADSGSEALALLDAEVLRRAMTALLPDHQRVLQFRFVEGRPVNEVAQLMAKTEGGVRVIQYRALRALKREIERNAPELVR
ncbi:MAG: sigma-70 family RNA polymerase sigma factor [Actinomycetota bacterium]